MNLYTLKYTLVICCVGMGLSMAPMTASLQHIDKNGCITGQLVNVIDTLKIDLAQYKDVHEIDNSLPINHISHAYNYLKLFYQDGNYQGRQDFYRKGGKPDTQLSREQAMQVLHIIRGRFALHKPQDPIEKRKADVVICAGVDWSLDKRIFSFEKFLAAGFESDNVFFLSRTVELDQSVKRAIERHKNLFAGKKLHPLYVPYSKGCSDHEDLVVALKPLISKEFYLISDPEYAGTLLETFTAYGTKHGLTCLGEFVRPITMDPDEYCRKDLAGYKINEFIPNEDDQIKAAAYSSLCLLGHQVMQEIKLYSPDKK